MYFIDDIDDNHAKQSHENPDYLGLFGYEKSHFWIESKQPWDTDIKARVTALISLCITGIVAKVEKIFRINSNTERKKGKKFFFPRT